MNASTLYDAVIIGGGLVGAAAAVVLKKQGKHVALLELRLPESDPAKLQNGWDARIYAISPANRHFLQSLNAWPDEARVQAVKRMEVRGDNGGKIEFSADAIHVDRLTSIVENRWLLAALWQQIKALDVPVINEAAAELHTDIHKACLKLANGDTIKTKLVIGADGAESWVRLQTGINAQEDAYGHHGVVSNFHTEIHHKGTAFQWFKGGEVLAYLPLPGNTISIVWSTAQPEKLTALPPEALAETVTAQGGNVLGKLSPLSPAFAFPLVLRRPETTVSQRVLLMGDAAHTIHPLAGQGVNLGFGDVIEFARLAEKAADTGAYQLLKQYAQNRLEPVRTMQLGCDGLFKLFGNETLPGLPRLRNSGLSLVNDMNWIKNRLIRHAMGL
ncbi:FAD-dependent monooxygenase [Neisseria canis]|uniref:Monooxygenase n=1 Tax=Neisseria canis TaxID=493 RepID=A0A1X3CWI8_9NEIS|nr:FAD-dependent monooxygenase [Neisseria canis]OSI12059.1 ubiquinone biosynthesis protein UbiH [Neisseria canis]VEF03144.1 monooxygenase [Neisseria canis]